jgi:hypothetical protein
LKPIVCHAWKDSHHSDCLQAKKRLTGPGAWNTVPLPGLKRRQLANHPAPLVYEAAEGRAPSLIGGLMPWIRLDDHFDEHPKIAGLTAGALVLWLRCLAYSNRNLTDGFVPDLIATERATRSIHYAPEDVIEELVNAGLWTETKNGYQIHDYLEYQGSRAQILEAREGTRLRVQAFRSRRNAVTNAGGNGVCTPSPTPTPKKTSARSLSPSSRLGTDTHLSPSGHAFGETDGRDPDEMTALEAFDRVFWPEYPRKVAKARARKAWKSLKLKDSDQETLEAIMRKLKNEKKTEWAAREIDKIPHPATWLNDRRWEDR